MSVSSIWTALRSYGLNEYGTAALMGNLKMESGLSSINVEDRCPTNDAVYTAQVDSGTYPRNSFVYDQYGYGLAQWTYNTRKAALYDYVKSKGKSIGDETTQIEFLIKELTSGWPTLLAYLKTTTNIEAATNRICDQYENPAASAARKDLRLQYAEAIYQECTGTAVSTTSTVSTTTLANYTAKVDVSMPILSQGDKGIAVGWAQMALIKKGYNLGTYGTNHDGVDYDFGATMLVAVNAFKAKKGINTSYGKVDKLTWEALYE